MFRETRSSGNLNNEGIRLARFGPGPGSPSSLLTSSDESSLDAGIDAQVKREPSISKSRSSNDSSDTDWGKSSSYDSVPERKSQGIPKMNPNTKKLLLEVFSAYCELEAGIEASTSNFPKEDTPRQGCRMTLEIWSRFCDECRLVEGELTSSKLELLFYDVAFVSGDSAVGGLRFEDFIQALGQVLSTVLPTVVSHRPSLPV
jgi:hypothetical protein